MVVTSAKVNVAPELQASVAVGVAKLGVAGHDIVEAVGKVEITGATVSITFIVCDLVEKFPHKSVAVHVLVTE